MSTRVALGHHFEAFIHKQVQSGRFNNASEVVHAGLCLLEEQEQHRLKFDALRAAIDMGLASGPVKPASAVFDRLEAKYVTQAKR